MESHPAYLDVIQSIVMVPDISPAMGSRKLSVPVKKLKNKKLAQKVRRLKDFCNNVCSFIETIIFKVNVKASTSQVDLEGLVARLFSQDDLKITPLKVVYIHLRDNRLYPKRKIDILNLYSSMQVTQEAD